MRTNANLKAEPRGKVSCVLSPQTHIDIGEFHTHPPYDIDPHRVIKPPSHFDIYQLIIAANMCYHNFVATVCKEGIYIIQAQRMAVTRMVDNLHNFYGDKASSGKQPSQAFTRDRSKRYISDCSMPHVDNVTPDTDFLHKLLIELPDHYYKAVDDMVRFPQNKDIFKHYQGKVNELHVDIYFYPK